MVSYIVRTARHAACFLALPRLIVCKTTPTGWLFVVLGGLVGAPGCNALLGADAPIVLDASSDGSMQDAGTEAQAAIYVDISAGQDPGAGDEPCAVIDTVNGKLLVATRNDSDMASPVAIPGLFRCSLDGTNCKYSDISPNGGQASGENPSAAVDTTNVRLLVVTRDPNVAGPALSHCMLDGTSCTYQDLDAGGGPGNTATGITAIDGTNQKLLVSTSQPDAAGMFICDLGGSNCVWYALPAGPGNATFLGVDSVNAKFLVLYDSQRLIRCDLDATSCVSADLSLLVSSQAPSVFAAIDAVNGRLLLAFNASNGTPMLRLCASDATGCTTVDISAGGGAGSGAVAAVLTDTMGHLLVVTEVAVPNTMTNSMRLGLLECALDGSNCINTDISTGVVAPYGFFNGVSAVVDESNRTLLVVAASAGTNVVNALGLYVIGL
jgi:hypothetical protein